MPRLSRKRLVSALAVVVVGGSMLAAVPAGADPATPGATVATTPSSTSTTSTTTAPQAAAPDAAPGTTADDRLLVTVAPGTTDGQARAIAAQAHATLQGRTGTTLILEPHADAGLRAASTSLAGTPGIVAVEPNLEITASATPNDTYWTDQYGLADSQPGGIRAQSAWNDTRGSRDVVVGVLDSGVALTHPDLTANLWTNRTGIGGCAYGTHGYDAVTSGESGHAENACVPADDDGHGTHVSGIIGATGDNNRGVTGVAQRVSIMPLRMLHHDTSIETGCPSGFSCATGGVADAVKAIDWALAAKSQGVNLRVLQASWGRSTSSVALSQAIARANSAGVLFVAAAGNGELVTDTDTVVPVDLDVPGNDEFPCEDAGSNVICVAATQQQGDLAGFSNYGGTAVDIAAPGFHILSTVPTGFFGCADPSYCEFDGTSMAAPMVSGAAVDVLAAYPALSVSALKAQLLASVDTSASLSGKVVSNGRLDVCKAIPNCDGRPATAPTAPTDVRVQVGDGSATVTWGAPDSNGNSFLVAGYDVEGPNGSTNYGFTTTSATVTGLTNNVTTTVRVRAVGTAANGPWVTVTIRPYAGGFEVDGLGALHRVSVGGKRPSAATGPSFPSDLARGVAILPSGTGGYVVDAYGGLHPFAIGAGSPTPPAATGGPYWLGWDIVRGVALSPLGGGYVLDGYGGIHTFGVGNSAPATAAKNGPYWNGFDIARGVTFAANGKGGYVADGYGGIHPFSSSGATPPAATGGPYWPGWNIVRGITLVPGSGGGWVLDGYGGPHPFATTGTKPAAPTASPYWPGQDIARGLDL
jgi:subtilisin family serine protease